MRPQTVDMHKLKICQKLCNFQCMLSLKMVDDDDYSVFCNVAVNSQDMHTRKNCISHIVQACMVQHHDHKKVNMYSRACTMFIYLQNEPWRPISWAMMHRPLSLIWRLLHKVYGSVFLTKGRDSQQLMSIRAIILYLKNRSFKLMWLSTVHLSAT